MVMWYYRVETFGVMHSNGSEKELNDFLKKKTDLIVSVNSFYNTILGCVEYVVLWKANKRSED